MGRLTQMRTSSSKSGNKAKYKRPKTPKQASATEAKREATLNTGEDSENVLTGSEKASEKENNQRERSSTQQPSGHYHADMKTKSQVDGKMKVDEMVGKVNNQNAEQFVEVLDEQLKQAKLQSEEDRIHENFMREALGMAELALATDETPVGCVFVYKNKIIARGMNATNRTLNGTRHAEYMAISSILSPPAFSTVNSTTQFAGASSTTSLDQETPVALPASVLHETDVYVTVEPCIMCASLLRQYGIRKVYYGASNDKFGGTGGVLNIHHDEVGDLDGYEVSGGWLREEAILALRKFYVQENDKAPEPRNKKERKLKTEILPFQKPATPALSTTRNKRFSKSITPSISSTPSSTSLVSNALPETGPVKSGPKVTAGGRQ